MANVHTINELLSQNRKWATDKTTVDPHYFDRLVSIQQPGYVWVGCSDSRVPANQIVALDPGEMFVQRNVANLVNPGDPNCMAVVQYAIESLGVGHVIICGHYGCGGVRAALEENFGGAAHVERWLAPLRQIARAHAGELAACATFEERWDTLCEINVVEQVQRMLACDVLTRARLRGTEIFVHGLVYGLKDGLLRELVPALV